MAIAGVSRNQKKFSFLVYKTLQDKGYDLYPINPNTDKNGSTNWYHTISELPDHVSNLLIVTNKKETEKVMKDAIQKGIKNIWIQQQSETPECLELAENNQINLISKACILMYTGPTGIHKFHSKLSRFFGSYVR